MHYRSNCGVSRAIGEHGPEPGGMQIERLAKEMCPEAVVMGAVKRGVLRQITIGSTAREVVKKLPCNLVAIRPGG